jgi:hypothetical protein
MPANWDEFDDTIDGDVGVLRLQGQTHELRACAAGPTPPDDPVEGALWLDTSGAQPALKQYQDVDGGGLAWIPLGPLRRLPESINADPDLTDDRATPFEYKALRPENRADLPTATPGNAGLVVYFTPDGEYYVADEPVSGGCKGLVSIVKDESCDTLEAPLADLQLDGANPPTAAAKGVVDGLLFDATAEKATARFVVPKNWQGASDLKVRIHQLLNQAETAGDDIEWNAEVRTLSPGADKVTKAASALLAVSTKDIGADADGIDDGGGPFVSELVIDHDDATNPVSAGCQLLVTFWRETVGGAGKVGGTLVSNVDLAYVQKPRHERA